MKLKAYPVSAVNSYISQYLAEDAFLDSIMVMGEVSGFKRAASGHLYFQLAEGGCTLRCVIFRGKAQLIRHALADGQQVMVAGRLTVYEKDGSCQLYGETVLPVGEGAEKQQLEQLREKLAAEGLFEAARKKPLPRLPLSIGVITSAEGAAWADIQRVAYARWPQLRLTLYPSSVQGAAAPLELVQAIAKADAGGHDVLICGRGGGAAADLSAFNVETVVRAVAAAKTPLISAVGHEIDFSLCDLAADMRAATPSHAAELAVPVKAEIEAELARAKADLAEALQGAIGAYRQQVGLQQQRLQQAFPREITAKRQHLAQAAAQLELLSPLKTLARGYALAEKGGVLLTDAAEVAPGERIGVRLAKGRLACCVEGKEDE